MNKLNTTFYHQYDLDTVVALMEPIGNDIGTFKIRVSIKRSDFERMTREDILYYCQVMAQGILRYAARTNSWCQSYLDNKWP